MEEVDINEIKNEAAVLKALHGEQCFPVLYDARITDHVAFLSMESYDGVSLLEFIREKTQRERLLRLPEMTGKKLSMILRLFRVGLAHLDIKSANFFLTAEEELILLDYARSRFQKGRIVQGSCGTRGFASPEAARVASTFCGHKADFFCGDVDLVIHFRI